MEIPVYQQLEPNRSHSYKLLRLTPDLIESLSGQDTITIKSSQDEQDLVLCSSTKTWKLRQMNQTNSVLLMDDKIQPGSLVGTINIPSQYELSHTDGYINTNDLPIYNGANFENMENFHQFQNTRRSKDPDINEIYSVEDLIDDSPISINQFYQQWYDLGGCEIENQCCILTTSLIKEYMDILLTLIITDGIDYKSDDYNISLPEMIDKLKAFNAKIEGNITTTLINKFCDYNPSVNKFKINNDKVAIFYGIITLKSLITPTDTKQFYLIWKNNLPNFYNIPINLNILKGWYYKNLQGIHYLNPGSLSNDLSTRVKQLFKFSQQWDLEDMEPFLTNFIINKKIESVLLKFAKVKTIDKRKVVIPR